MKEKEFELEIGGKKITAVFNDLADQANGSVVLKSEDTVVMATAVISKDGRSNPGFFNLTVEYLEKFYAAGKILGSQFMRREGRPSDQALLSARMIDRTLRPLFDRKIKNAIQIIVTVLAVGKADPKILGINAASIALHTSDIPWAGPVGAVHIGSPRENKEEVGVNNYIPSSDEPVYGIDLVVCGKENTINMIEAMSYEFSEDKVGGAFDMALAEIAKWEEFQKMLGKEVGKEKMVFEKIEVPQEAIDMFEKEIVPILNDGLFGSNSKSVIHEAEIKWKDLVEEKYTEDEGLKNVSLDYVHSYIDKELHDGALTKDMRADMRAMDEVRDLHAKAGGISPVLHGSGIFYRGETHVLSVLTLAGPEAAHTIDGIEFSAHKKFLHHYNFPPYSAGETGRVGGINRRETGHGFLAEKALWPVIPNKTDFPYTIRVVSESTASNGSTSQASICAATVALMDGGVPIKSPVAGISVGAMIDEKDPKNYKLLTDIQGPEDHHGDMDFKVAGTREGVTAIQLDIKVGGIPVEVLKDALTRAREARLKIIDAIEKEISSPRSDISPNAPKIVVAKIDKEQIGLVIGPGGKNINAIREETGTEISIEEDGTVFISGRDGGADKAKAIIEEMTHEYKVGDTQQGTVVKIVDFGAFVRIGKDKEGLVHISEIAPFRVASVRELLKEGDVVPTKVIKTDDRGKLSLSIKEADKDFFKDKIVK